MLMQRHDLDAIVLVDGGTDILMQGDESGVGTPEEDMASLAAVAGLSGVDRLVVSLGFGIDSFRGVSHADVLENLAALQREGGYLGALSIPPDSPEALAYLDAVTHAQASTPLRPSIVNVQIAAAVRGQFGNVHVTTRTGGSELQGVGQQRERRPLVVTVRNPHEAGLLVQAMGGGHPGLGVQDQPPDSPLDLEADNGLHQQPPDAATLGRWVDGQGADLGLCGTDGQIAGLVPALQHDRAEDPVVLDCDQDHAVLAQRAQAVGVGREGVEEVPGMVGGHPEFADRGQFGRLRRSHDHHSIQAAGWADVMG
jgi:hypothetical protein